MKAKMADLAMHSKDKLWEHGRDWNTEFGR